MIVNPIIPIWLMSLICIGLMFIRSKNKYSFIRQILIIILLFVINLRIMIQSSDVTVMTNNLDVLFVIDNTISMLAEDCRNNEQRLVAVKKDCEYIIEKLSGARFSVMTFNNDSQIITPYTKDADMTLEAINIIQVMNELYAKGSSLNVAKKDMVDLLEKSAKKQNKNRIVFFISDGEITNDDKLESFSNAKKYINNGAVLGYGTTKGGQMKIKDRYTGEEEYLKDLTDYNYENAVSKIDESNLKQLSKDMGIDYINMMQQSNINYKLNEISKELKNEDGELKKSYVDIYYIFAVPLTGLLIYEFINYRRRL